MNEMTELGKRLKKWDNDTVINIKSANGRVEEIINEMPEDIRKLNLRELELALMCLSQYALFLTNELSRTKARSRFLKTKFDDRLAQIMNTIQGKSKDERILKARNSDKKLADIFYLLEEQEEKKERLENLPMSINIFLNTVKNVYFRKQNDAKNVK